MADPIVVSVEIKDSDYVKEFEVDPAEPLVKLLQRVAKEEEIPLRKKSGHPLVWTAEGPDIREEHAGEWAELTRTQPLTRISKVVLDRYGERAPLFSIRFSIPGAAEALDAKAEEEKRAEIEARMAQRAAERQAEKSAAIGEAEDEFVMDYAAPADEAPTLTPEPATVQDPNAGRGMGGAAAAAAGVAAGAVAVGAMAAAAGASAAGSVESRIKRRGDGGAQRSAAGSTGGARARGGKGGGKGSSGKGSGGKSGGGKGTRTGKSRAVSTGTAKARAGKGGGKKGGKGGGKGGPLSDLPSWAIPAAAGGGLLLLVGILAVVFSGGEPEPEPTPEPTPPPEIVDIEVATPSPPPPKPEPEEEVTPPPMEQFYSRAKIVDYQAKEVSAQLTSFTKTNVRIVYNALHPNDGQSHTISLEGRFKLKISNGGGNMNGKAFTAGVTPGKASRVDLRYDGSRLTVRVGGRRAGSWSVPDSGGFPRWRLDLDSGIELSGLRASAQVEE